MADVPKKHKGALNELLACAWLLQEGYEVFRNLSAHGLVDLVAIRDGAIIKIDVKAGAYGVGGREVIKPLYEEQIAEGIIALYVFPDGKCRIEWTAPGFVEDRLCRCGTMFSPTRYSHLYCSVACQPSIYVKKGRLRRRGKYKKSVYLNA